MSAVFANDPWHPNPRAAARVPHGHRLPAPTECPHCGGDVLMVNNARIYRKPYGKWPWAYLCLNTRCGAFVGMHPFTAIPLGTLATKPIRDARMRAKSAFNPIWQSERMTRTEAYLWLAAQLDIPAEECHIGRFDVERCDKAVAICRAYMGLTA